MQGGNDKFLACLNNNNQKPVTKMGVLDIYIKNAFVNACILTDITFEIIKLQTQMYVFT